MELHARDIRLIVPDNILEFGKKVNNHIKLIKNSKEDFIIRPNLERFYNGEGKCILDESIRGKDTYILSDVSNWNITYKCKVGIHHMMPDEHFQDIKRIINATCKHAYKMTVVMPYLYQSRQDKRNGRESLDLAMALDDLQRYGVRELITADVHNKSACDNASIDMAIDNFYCSDDIIHSVIKNEYFEFDNSMVASPDFGAMSRSSFYAGILGNIPLGIFYKQRDYAVVMDGKNPILQHKFLYEGDITGRDVIVVDDMIASGGSILDTASQLRKRGAGRIFLLATFGLFDKGEEIFDEAYEKGIFDRVYTTNLNYVKDSIKSKEWYREVDCSMKVASIICNINEDKSIGNLLNAKAETLEKIKQLRKSF